MKNLIVLAVFFLSILNGQAQEKIYMFSQVDVAPKLFNYSLIDSLDTQQNFKKNLREHIFKNLEMIKSKRSKVEKAYVQFVIKSDGSVEVQKVRGTSKLAKKYAYNVIKKIKRMTPAIREGKNVSVKYIVPIKFITLVLKKISF